MKKVVAAFATTGVLVFGATTMNVSAAEYEVEKNDTLWGISQEYGTTVDQLVDKNDLDSTTIHPGQVIQTENDAKEESSNTSSNEDKYTIEKGDTLSGIALLHGVTIDELKEWNNLSSSLIISGQDLTIKGLEEEAVEEEASEPAESESTDEEQSEDNSNEAEEVSNEASEEDTNEDVEVETVSNEDSEEANETEESEATEEDTNENATAEAEASEEESSNDAEGETMSVTATAYTAKCDGCSGVSATGIDLGNNPDKKVIAVDPDVIPLGSTVQVEGYGEAIAGDVGGAINGEKIDVHMPTKEDANNWGVQTVNITVLD